LVCIRAYATRDGSLMVRSCHLAIAQNDGRSLSGSENEEAIVCTAYVAGFLDALHLSAAVGNKTLDICLPDERLDVLQAAGVLLKYLDTHP
jgi:hypothetical protein